MAFRSGLFNSVNGDRKYQAAHFAEYFATFIGNGVFPNPSNGLQVYAKENMTVTIKPGKAWINGYYFVNDSACDLKIENADGVLKRKDRIVLRFDTSTRLITPEIRKGVFSASPAVPNIQRDADAYELALATVSIDKGTVALTQAAITDERLNTTVCGIVHGVVDQVDTATLFSQYQTWYAEKMEQYNTLMTNTETSFNNQLQAQQTAFESQSVTNQNIFDNQTMVNQQSFDEWFISVQNLLSGDVAANIISHLDNHVNDTTAHGIGNKELLNTTEKDTIVDAINEIFDVTSKKEYEIIGEYSLKDNNSAEIQITGFNDYDFLYLDCDIGATINPSSLVVSTNGDSSTMRLGRDVTNSVDSKLTNSINAYGLTASINYSSTLVKTVLKVDLAKRVIDVSCLPRGYLSVGRIHPYEQFNSIFLRTNNKFVSGTTVKVYGKRGGLLV